jgi:(R)-2-hydroxyacyl-CoA dehydratese activating ATPase
VREEKEGEMITAGIDIGSITTKVAFLDDKGIIGEMVDFTGYNARKAGRDLFDKLLLETGLDEGSIGKIVSTGYGRNSVDFAHKAITEITCHAAGAYFLDRSVRSIIDVGGQDSKALLLYEGGKVRDFAMNDKCAAGTGRFLEVMARALHLDLDEMGEIALNPDNPSKISSICTVFAESEVISLISKGESRENIIAGINESVASRVTALARRVNVAPPVMMTGGVAKNKGVVKALEDKLGTEIIISPHAQINGAIGAAILAGDI